MIDIRLPTAMSNCNSNNDGGGGDDCGRFHEDDRAEDISYNNSATTSSSSSSSLSLTSLYDNNATDSSSSSDRSRIINRNEFDQKKLWWIHGNGYDLMDFVQDHPGGIEAILLGKGRDCTALVESYHAFSGGRVWKILEKHRCPTRLQDDDGDDDGEDMIEEETNKLATATAGQLRDRVPDFFYEVLKKRVTKVLRSKGVDPVKDRGASQIRIVYYIMVLISWLYTGYLHCKANLWGSFAFAVTGWLMAALGHDAGHYAASRWAVVNEYGVWAMSSICNPVMWQQQHTYGHHSFTNEFDRDPDLHHFADNLLRVHKKFQYETKHRHQSNLLYVFFVYSFVVFGECLYLPCKVLSEGNLHGIVDWHDKDRPTKFYGMLLHLVSYVGIIFVVPTYTHESFGKAALASYIHFAMLGITFALFSQLNHLNELSLESDMDSRHQQQHQQKEGLRDVKRDPRLARSWAAAQVETSNNFATQSTLWYVLSNGTNHQIEHHLFPSLNHGHLHHIVPVVKQTCEEFGVQYKSYDTWSDLMNAAWEWLDKLSVIDHNKNIDIDDNVIPTAPDMKNIKVS